MLKAIRSYQAKMFIDEEKKSAAGKLDDFWLLVTNHTEKDGDRFVHRTQSKTQGIAEKIEHEPPDWRHSPGGHEFWQEITRYVQLKAERDLTISYLRIAVANLGYDREAYVFWEPLHSTIEC